MESQDQFEYSPTGLAAKWSAEMAAAEENQKYALESGAKVVKRFLDNRSELRNDGETRVNLFTSNVQTLQALLYGKEPKVDVKRRFADHDDKVARLGAEILQRLLNTDIERDSDTYAGALENCLEDRLLPGLGQMRLRYEADFDEQDEVPPINDHTCPQCTTRAPMPVGEAVPCPSCGGEMQDSGKELAPAYTPDPVKTHEDVDCDYVHWEDFRWSPCRTWDEVRWVAFKAPMTRDAMRKRFPEYGEQVPLAQNRNIQKDENDGLKNDPWARADVWEIWCKEDRKCYWWVKGFDKILDVKEDPLGLDGFFPCPRPLIANVTTTKFVQRADYVLAQDLYDEVDMVSTRITLLERAIAVRGVYDKSDEGIRRLLSESVANELIPIDNFAAFKEKGGLAGVVDWLPLEQIVGALQVLREYRSELMQVLYQVTGMSDIMRGQSQSGATATEQSLKAKFASARVQRLQNDFARFASDVQSLKAEIISKHFDPKTIVERSNIQYMVGADQQLAQQAVGLVKSNFYQYRIEVKPESVSMADMAAVKQERSEFLMAISQFLQSSLPVGQAAPWAMPYLLQMLQWAIAGFRGGSTIEGVLDQMVLAATQAAQQAQMQPPPPNPQLQVAQVKAQAEGQKAQMGIAQQQTKMKADLAAKLMDLKAHQAKTAVDIHKANLDAAHGQAEHEQSMQQLEAKTRAEALKATSKETGNNG
jgi:hypothetical protein